MMRHMFVDVEQRPDDELCYATLQLGPRELRAKRRLKVRGKSWDIFRLVNFLSYMPDSFRCESVEHTRAQDYERVTIIKEDLVRVFEVYMTSDLDRIDLYLRGTSEWPEWSDTGRFTVPRPHGLWISPSITH